MKLLLLGATGRTGAELVKRALDEGHQLTALARNPGKLVVHHERLRVIAGNVTDAAAIEQAVKGHDAVLCALGPRSPTALVHCNLMRATADALVRAMGRGGVNRLLHLSALGAGQSAPYAPTALRIAFRTAFREIGIDKAESERQICASPLDWTIVYPPTLTKGSATGDYRHGEALTLSGLPRISRADTASFMLSQLGDTTYSRRIAIIGPRANRDEQPASQLPKGPPNR